MESSQDQTELCVRSLSYDVDEEALRETFEPHGTLTKCKLLRGLAFIQYETHEEAKKALEEEDGKELMGRKIQVQFSGQSGGNRGGPSGGPRNSESNTLFVGNLSFKLDEEQITAFFEECGSVTSVRIAMNEEGRPRGFAHVEFGSAEEAKKALETKNGEELEGRQIRLDFGRGRRRNDE